MTQHDVCDKSTKVWQIHQLLFVLLLVNVTATQLRLFTFSLFVLTGQLQEVACSTVCVPQHTAIKSGGIAMKVLVKKQQVLLQQEQDLL